MADLKRSSWGPATWTFLHTAAAALDDPAAFQALLALLPRTLPCPECRSHSSAYLAAHPPALAVRDAETASRYVYEFHNAVNERLGKPQATPQTLQTAYNVVLPELRHAPTRFERVRPYRRF